MKNTERRVRVGGNRGKDGLYIGKFETNEEAVEYVRMLARKYQYSPHPKRTTVASVCRWARRDGARIYPTTLGRWFKSMGITIRRSNTRPRTKTELKVSVDNEVFDSLQEYPNKSYVANLALNIALRKPTKDVILFLPSGKGEEPINIIFQSKGDSIKALATGRLNKRDKAMVRGLISAAQDKGMRHITDYAKLFGYKYYGGTYDEFNSESEGD